jgi:type II restriction enzyme
MSLQFNLAYAESYNSETQRVRRMSEKWLVEESYCPACGGRLAEYPNNKPVRDTYCEDCGEKYELKSKKSSETGLLKLPEKIVDGAYATMMQDMEAQTTPNLLFLQYLSSYTVASLLVIPKQFFVPALIEKRKPLSETARRAGWVGCNILLEPIPQVGRIPIIQNKVFEPKDKVISIFQKTLFLRHQQKLEAKGWLLDVMRCVELIGKETFTLQDIYQHEAMLKDLHPENNNVQAKIRQQLQVLRDAGFLAFLDRGVYRVV